MAKATSVSDIERAEHLNYGDGAGVKRVSVYNNGTQVNAATEETLQSIAGLEIPAHDYIGASYPDTSTEVYTYKTGGGAGTTVATITVVYSDAVTKQILTSVTKS